MSLDHVPPTLQHYDVPTSALEETWAFMRQRGRLGVEAVVLWVGHVSEPSRAEVVAAVKPRQIAHKSPEGLSVEVPQDALTQLILSLPEAVHVLVRLHSHGEDAYHSSLDDSNMIIAHEGAISIVIPHFGAGPADFTQCSVNVLSRQAGWHELSTTEIRERFQVV